jgi:hypothetical protein
MIDPDLRAFIEGGVGIHIGSRGSRLEPNGARVTAVRVEEDLLHLLVYVPDVAASRVLPDLKTNGAAAVVFARPIDDRACQIKGIFAGSRPAADEERGHVEQQWDAFLTSLEQIGIPRAGAAGWIIWPSTVIRLRATALFEQTPGPQAGAQVVPRP